MSAVTLAAGDSTSGGCVCSANPELGLAAGALGVNERAGILAFSTGGVGKLSACILAAGGRLASLVES